MSGGILDNKYIDLISWYGLTAKVVMKVVAVNWAGSVKLANVRFD